MPTAEPIETTCTEEPAYTPSAVPRGGPDRADVLTQARLLAAEAAGVAALVEGAVGKARPEFVDAWRRWYGAWLGRHIALERLPWEPAVADAEVGRWQQRLGAWRQGLTLETRSQQTDAAPTPAAASAPAPRKGWPWWAVMLGLGGGGILLWKVGQWIFTPSYTSTGQIVNDVVETADAVNGVRRGR